MIKNLKNTAPWRYIVNEFNGEELIGPFCEKELQRINQKEFRMENVTERKGNNL